MVSYAPLQHYGAAVSFLDWFKRDNRLANIAVYYAAAVVDGQVRAAALGLMPRFSADYEKRIRAMHRPTGAAFINETAKGVSIILAWEEDRINAVCFLSANDARAFPGVTEIPNWEIDSVLTHFPRA